ncbi:uncharacterized protein G2W53_041186 [Senna tora]|uniref:Uncharacterized protein n=1 Tax=Senna tora TaxID=362788 RepID=A0A834SDC0_9FABA|nr:uncharacterized protein G2W53_041186 [Senna tora]
MALKDESGVNFPVGEEREMAYKLDLRALEKEVEKTTVLGCDP